MKIFLIRLCLAGLGSVLAVTMPFSTVAVEPRPLSVPELNDLIEPWIFVRASEASTLFIDEAFEGREPYGHLVVRGEKDFQWLEFDGSVTRLWNVSAFVRDEKQLTLTLIPVAGDGATEPSQLVVYPYWDIDDCLIMIRFDPGAEENPVRFSTPYAFKHQLPFLEPEG
ncbi:MAG: hypothetical protein AAGJ79_06345 [Verrucomicrobiota bacterium]